MGNVQADGLQSGKALLVVSFGTSVTDAADKTIGAIERALDAAIDNRELWSCWTSRVICEKVERETGVHHMQLGEALDALAAHGVTDVLVQPTHMMQGRENKLMIQALREHRDDFERVLVGDTLLVHDKDCERLADALCTAFGEVKRDEVLLLMGHGSHKGGNESFYRMQRAFELLGRENVIVATVEGEPTFDDALAKIETLHPRRVWLAPFMIVAGDHALNDMAGDDANSWASQLAARGYETHCVLRGLGEYSQVQELFIAHAHAAIALEQA